MLFRSANFMSTDMQVRAALEPQVVALGGHMPQQHMNVALLAMHIDQPVTDTPSSSGGGGLLVIGGALAAGGLLWIMTRKKAR